MVGMFAPDLLLTFKCLLDKLRVRLAVFAKKTS